MLYCLSIFNNEASLNSFVFFKKLGLYHIIAISNGSLLRIYFQVNQ